MVALLFLLLIPSPTVAVWQDELFGHPAPGYFANSFGKLQSFTIERFGGNNQWKKGAQDFLSSCVRSIDSWYFEDKALRLSSYSIRLASINGKKQISLRCIPSHWTPELKRLRKNLMSSGLPEEKIIGFEFFLGSKKIAAIERPIGIFVDGAPPAESGFFLPQAVQAWAKAGEGYRLELRAYADGIAPKELREDVEVFHKEFGLLADSILWTPDNGAEIFFP